MEEIADAPTLRARLETARCAGQSIGLVPTMGYLHDGHLRLLSQARFENDLVVASIFVNPTQFGPTEDLERYPRDLDRDRTLAQSAGVDVLFAPDLTTMYPDGPNNQELWIEPGSLAAHLDGAARPHHFRGVATVVSKLFNLTHPDRAYFGQKDGQQALIVRRMVRDLAYDITIVIVPTARDSDGLALSSRNVYLSAEERAQATAIPNSLALARALIVAGRRDSQEIRERIREHMEREAALARVDFIEVADMVSISPVPTIDGDVMIAIGVFFGETRLIDNLMVHFVDGMPHFE